MDIDPRFPEADDKRIEEMAVAKRQLEAEATGGHTG
jgi:hypothetical protein